MANQWKITRPGNFVWLKVSISHVTCHQLHKKNRSASCDSVHHKKLKAHNAQMDNFVDLQSQKSASPTGPNTEFTSVWWFIEGKWGAVQIGSPCINIQMGSRDARRNKGPVSFHPVIPLILPDWVYILWLYGRYICTGNFTSGLKCILICCAIVVVLTGLYAAIKNTCMTAGGMCYLIAGFSGIKVH